MTIDEIKEVEAMKTYTLLWRTGDSEIIRGTSIADAFMRAGYSAGAIRALDFYHYGDRRAEWHWDGKNWAMTAEGLTYSRKECAYIKDQR